MVIMQVTPSPLHTDKNQSHSDRILQNTLSPFSQLKLLPCAMITSDQIGTLQPHMAMEHGLQERVKVQNTVRFNPEQA